MKKTITLLIFLINIIIISLVLCILIDLNYLSRGKSQSDIYDIPDLYYNGEDVWDWDEDSRETLQEINGNELKNIEIIECPVSVWIDEIKVKKQLLEKLNDKAIIPSPSLCWSMYLPNLAGVIEFKNGARGKITADIDSGIRLFPLFWPYPAAYRVIFQDKTGKAWYFSWEERSFWPWG